MRQLGIRKKLLFTAMFTLSVLIALELLARAAYTFKHNLAPQAWSWIAYDSNLGWTPKPEFHGDAYNVVREFDGEGFLKVDSADIRNDEKPRILFLGDSSTFGFGVRSEDTFVEQVDRLIPEVSAINCGVVGYTSYQGLKVLQRHGDRLRPAVVVVSFNFNDRRFVDSESGPDSAAKFERLARTHRATPAAAFARTASTRSYLARALASLLAPDHYRIREFDLDRVQPRVSIDSYRENLNRIADLSRDLGATCVFMAMTDNPVQTEYTRRGFELLEDSKPALAVPTLESMLGKEHIGNKVAARLLLMEAYRRLGREEDARRLAVLSQPFYEFAGGAPMYVDERYNHVMREVARERGLMVAEVGHLLNKTPSDYQDWCHPDAHGHRKIAILLRETLANVLHQHGVHIAGG